jgi:hypothetical protein
VCDFLPLARGVFFYTSVLTQHQAAGVFFPSGRLRIDLLLSSVFKREKVHWVWFILFYRRYAID